MSQMKTKILIVGGSDAGTMAALRIKELAPEIRPTMVLADEYPNFSICGIPFFLAREVTDYWHLAHRTRPEIEKLGLDLLTSTYALSIDMAAHRCLVRNSEGAEESIVFEKLILGTGAKSIRPPIEGLDQDGVFTLRWMGEARAIDQYIQDHHAQSVILIGGGYINMELADGLSKRGLSVSVLEFFPSVLTTVDAEFGGLVREELERHGVKVFCGEKAASITREGKSLAVHTASGKSLQGDLVIVCTGARPATELAESAGAELGEGRAIKVNQRMESSIPGLFAAGDCGETYHRVLGRNVYLPLGSTSHKQGRIAGENALGGTREFAGTLGTQVVKIFDLIAARTGFKDSDASPHGFSPLTWEGEYWDHKSYYPGAKKIRLRLTGDRETGKFLGVQMLGAPETLVAKRIDAAAVALHHGASVDDLNDLDLSYSPPLNSPWDPLQSAAQDWVRHLAETA